MSPVRQVLIALIHTVFLGDIVVVRVTNLCRPYSVYVFLGDKFCRTGDNICLTKTLFCVLCDDILLLHIHYVFLGSKLYLPCGSFISHQRSFCFFRQQIGFLGDNTCCLKTLFLCFVRRHTLVLDTSILYFWAISCVSRAMVFVARTQFLFVR